MEIQRWLNENECCFAVAGNVVGEVDNVCNDEMKRRQPPMMMMCHELTHFEIAIVTGLRCTRWPKRENGKIVVLLCSDEAFVPRRR